MQAGDRQNHDKKTKTIKVEDAPKIKKAMRDTPGDPEDENNGVSQSGDGKDDNAGAADEVGVYHADDDDASDESGWTDMFPVLETLEMKNLEMMLATMNLEMMMSFLS